MPLGSTTTTWYDALGEFLIHQEATRAKKTARFYSVQLRQLAHWADDNDVPFGSFGKRHLDRYLIERAKTVSPTTLRHDAVCAKAFFKWCQRNDLIERSFLTDYEIRRAPKPARYLPTDAEVQGLLTALSDFWDVKKNPPIKNNAPFKRLFHRTRNYAIILGLLDTACRIGEMLSLKVEDFRGKELQVLVRESKGREPRAIPISPEWADAVSAWMKVRERLMSEAEEDEGYLFVSEFGGKIDESKFLKSVKRYIRFAEMSEEITLHCLRRYSLNKLAKYNLLGAQSIAGHKDPKTTLLYTRLDADFVRGIHSDVGVLQGVLSSKRAQRKKLL